MINDDIQQFISCLPSKPIISEGHVEFTTNDNAIVNIKIHTISNDNNNEFSICYFYLNRNGMIEDNLTNNYVGTYNAKYIVKDVLQTITPCMEFDSIEGNAYIFSL